MYPTEDLEIRFRSTISIFRSQKSFDTITIRLNIKKTSSFVNRTTNIFII